MGTRIPLVKLFGIFDPFVPAENSLALHNTGSGSFRVLSFDLGQTWCARGQELRIYRIDIGGEVGQDARRWEQAACFIHPDA